MIRHVVWDWNGTLLADQRAVLDALNLLLARLERPATDMATYRRLFRRPVRDFYEDLLAETIDDERWDQLDQAFHRAYATVLHDVALHAEARAALEQVATSGRSQSLLSMAPHAQLAGLVAEHHLVHHFDRVDGVRGSGGGHKEQWLHAHLEALSVADPDQVVLIGDALDDAVAARAVGAQVVLYDGGTHPPAALAEVGVPVATSLLAAVDLVERAPTAG